MSKRFFLMDRLSYSEDEREKDFLTEVCLKNRFTVGKDSDHAEVGDYGICLVNKRIHFSRCHKVEPRTDRSCGAYSVVSFETIHIHPTRIRLRVPLYMKWLGFQPTQIDEITIDTTRFEK